MSNKLRIVNIGISSFYDALCAQDCEATQIDWHPPVKISEDMARMLDLTMQGELAEKIDAANEEAADMVIQADPAWVDILPAGEVVEGLDDYTVTHSGPPIAFDDMVMLHQRGMVSACLFEGWAKTEEEALELIKSGKMAGTIKQDAEGMAGGILKCVKNGLDGKTLLEGMSDYNIDSDVAKVRIAYAVYMKEN